MFTRPSLKLMNFVRQPVINFYNLKAFSKKTKPKLRTDKSIHSSKDQILPSMKVETDEEKFSAHIRRISAFQELPDLDREMHNTMNFMQDPKFSVSDFLRASTSVDSMTPEEREKLEKDREMLKKKYEESEKHILDVSHKFEDIDYWTHKMLMHSPNPVIKELAIRLFVGSRDIPKNVLKAKKYLEVAKSKIEGKQNTAEALDIAFTEIMLEKMSSKPPSNPEEFFEEQSKLLPFVEAGHPQAAYVYGSELYNLCSSGVFQDKMQIKGYLLTAYDYLSLAASWKIHSANYYLGLFKEEGIVVGKSVEEAFNFYVEGAAHNNAMWFYKLSSFFGKGIFVNKNPYLQFKYLRRSAEEGYVIAQHMLGIAYFQGNLIEKDDKLALAWFRESARNGEIVSFINAGDVLWYRSEISDKILTTFPEDVKQFLQSKINTTQSNITPNLLFSLAQYMTAYRYGAYYLKDRIEMIGKHLYELGEFKVA